MQRPEYNQTVRETLRQLQITVDDCLEIYANKDDFNNIMSRACYEKFDSSFQSVIQAVNLLELLYNIIKSYNPDITLLYQLLSIWQESLLQEDSLISQYFSKQLHSTGIKLVNDIQTAISNFCGHIQRSNCLIQAVLDFPAPETLIEVDPLYIPAHSYQELSLAKPAAEKGAQDAEKEVQSLEDPAAKLKEELELMSYEDRFGRRMQVDILKEKRCLEALRLLQSQERQKMEVEENFSNQLTQIYRAELKNRAEIQHVQRLVSETVAPSLNSCFQNVTTTLRGDQKKK